MGIDISKHVGELLENYDPKSPDVTANGLRSLWLQFEPKSIAVIKAEQRQQQETIGIPVPVLKEISKSIAKVARKHVADFIPLARLLWESYGREGRVVTLPVLGAMELSDPEIVVPLLMTLCRDCLTWEDCDRLAMDALEPIVRKEPEKWLAAMARWLEDENKWLRRAGVTVIGRLAMKYPLYTPRCLELTKQLLWDEDMDVKRAVSFAIRISVRGEAGPVYEFMKRHVPPENPAAAWVLCDVIRSMGKALLPGFVPLLPLYEQWVTSPTLSSKDRKSVESAIKTLQGA
ncbi:MAG: DNA alkylation repair protein [Chloroflexota bacterium]